MSLKVQCDRCPNQGDSQLITSGPTMPEGWSDVTVREEHGSVVAAARIILCPHCTQRATAPRRSYGVGRKTAIV